VIRSFADKDTERLFGRQGVRRFQSFERVALRRLRLLDAAEALGDLKGPGLSLEALKRERKGQHSIRINDQWRVCFVWRDGDAYNVEIADYH
jgi:proteic killer suppression protein